MRVLVCVLALLLLLAGVLPGQLDRGTITGTVTDSSGSRMPNATVKAIHVDTNVERTTRTSGQGDYQIPQLPLGTYRVEVSASGFRSLARSGIVITAGSTVRVDAALELGSLAETVTVSAEAPQLQTDSARVVTAVSTKLVDDLPLIVSGGLRSAIDLVLIAPEAKPLNNIALGGGQTGGWDLQQDGISATPAYPGNQRLFTNLNSLSTDAITEVALDTNGFKAEFGRTSGGIISFVSRSGTNDLHGTAFEYLRNNAMDANSFFSNKTGAKKAVLKQSDFGFTAGGPVYLPKIYNGRNKTFFFTSYEGFRNRVGASTIYQTIPLPEMYKGDFSNWKDKKGTLIPIYNPQTTRSDGKGGFTRDPFPANQISPSLFSQISKNVIALATMAPNQPDPTGVLNPNPRTNFVTTAGGSVSPWTKFSIKADHLVTPADRVNFLYHYARSQVVPLGGKPPGLPEPLTNFLLDDTNTRVYRVSWDKTISSSTVNRLSFGMNDLFRLLASVNMEKGWGTKIGLKNVPNPDLLFPTIAMDDYTQWGLGQWGGSAQKGWALIDDFSLFRGTHGMKFGFQFQEDHYDGYGQHTAAGNYQFSRLTTSRPLDQTGATGNGFASMLLGEVYSATIMTKRNVADQWRYWAGYAQDDWRASSKLTVSYGVRYEYTPPMTEGYGPDWLSNFDPNLPNPKAGGLKGALIFAGAGPGRTGKRTMWGGWRWGVSPRLGVAYSLDSRTVVRVSGSRSFGTVKNTGTSAHYHGFVSESTRASNDQGITSGFRWDGGFPPWTPPPFIDPSLLNDDNSYYWQPYDTGRLPEYLNWSLNVQRQLSKGVVAEIGYNAMMGRHLTTSLVNMNQVDPRIFDRMVAERGGTAAINLMNSNITSATARAANIAVPYEGFKGTVSQALRPYPQYRNIDTGADGGDRSGKSNYHALILKLEKRYSSGLSLLGSYVLSKMFSTAESATAGTRAMDQYNRGLEKTLSSSDQTHVFKVNYSYELPFGKGRSFLNSGAWGWIAGGWRIAAIQSYYSGIPMSIAPGYNLPLFSGAGNRMTVLSYDGWRAPVAGGKFDPFVDSWWNVGAFDKNPADSLPSGGSAKAVVLRSQLGNATVRNPRARGPWNMNESVSLARGFRIREAVRMDFRLESFNIFNRVQWGGPNNTVTSNTFGQIRSQANTPRQMQLGLKITF